MDTSANDTPLPATSGARCFNCGSDLVASIMKGEGFCGNRKCVMFFTEQPMNTEIADREAGASAGTTDTPRAPSSSSEGAPTDKQRADAYAEILHELIRPDNGYCNQCGGAWSYRAEGRWSYFDGDHTPSCVGRRVLERRASRASGVEATPDVKRAYADGYLDGSQTATRVLLKAPFNARNWRECLDEADAAAARYAAANDSPRASIPSPEGTEPLTPEWCIEAFYRVNPGAHQSIKWVPSLYLLDFAREALRTFAPASQSAGAETPR